MTTYRERREAKAERLQEWAEKRAQKAEAGFRVGEEHRGDTAFWTQPGRVPQRDRVYRAHERAHEDSKKAASMTARASGITDQLDRAIYSDDANAIEALEERIATLERDRTIYKAINKHARKGHPVADLEAELGAPVSERTRRNYEELASTRSALPAYVLSNLSGNITRNRKRLEHLRKVTTEDRPLRVIRAHRDGDCERCGEPIEAGAWIGKYLDGWSHVHEDGDNWKRC